MKTINKIALISLMVMGGVSTAQAQEEVLDNLHFTIDWQGNAPVSTDFAEKFSGYGMNFEANYDITPHWTVGGFINFHTNHGYIPTQTISYASTSNNMSVVTTDQLQSAYQLPFGVNVRYNIVPQEIGNFRPYVGVKTGAMYSKYTTYFNSVGYYDNPWGFYVSPEIGLNIYPKSTSRFGFHIAGYYSFATNQSKDWLGTPYNGQNNVGFRVGITF